MSGGNRYSVSLDSLLETRVAADELVQEQPCATPLTNPALWGGALEAGYRDGPGGTGAGGGCDGGGCE